MDRPASWHRNSLEVPAFYMPPSPSEKPARAFEPTPQHGLHARNLSAYFPHPGAPQRVPSPTPAQPAGDSVIPDADKSAFGAGADHAPPAGESTERTRTSKRRGHHVSPSATHLTAAPPLVVPQLLLVPRPDADQPPCAPAAVRALADAHDTHHPQPGRRQAAARADGRRVVARHPLAPSSKKDPQAQALTSFAVIEAVLGIGLWVEGQMSGWRCLTAAGYLVVFDAMGMGVNLFARTDRLGWRSLRRPYG
jgi:hypothetical protein